MKICKHNVNGKCDLGAGDDGKCSEFCWDHVQRRLLDFLIDSQGKDLFS